MSSLDYSFEEQERYDSSPRRRYDDDDSDGSLESVREDGEIYDDFHHDDQDHGVGASVRTSMLVCEQHLPGKMIRSCTACVAVLDMVKPDVVESLLAQTEPTVIGDTVSRYAARSDDVSPTLDLSSGIIDLAENVFNAGMFKNKSHFSDMTKKYLLVSTSDHERLTKDLQMETLVKSLEAEKRFKPIFSLRKDFGDSVRKLRISQRIVFSVLADVHGSFKEIKQLGTEAGILFTA